MESLLTYIQLSPSELYFMLICGFIAGMCRGFAGFGLSALIVTSLSLILLPSQVVPIVLLAEMFSSLVMARMTWSSVNWQLLRYLLIGALIGVPFGVLILTSTPPDVLRIVISVTVLLVSLVLLFGRGLHFSQSTSRNTTAGFISGIANGAAIGGLPVAIYMMAVALPAEAVRATLNVYFFVLDAYSTGAFIFAGLLDQVTVIRAILIIAPIVLGIFLGNRLFKKSSANLYRYFVLSLLILLSLIGLSKSLF